MDSLPASRINTMPAPAGPDGPAMMWSEHAFITLRRDILSGRLRPGIKLRVEQLRDHYGVGSTPLREALSRLSSEGLVRMEQQRGFRVASVTQAELEELCELRVLIEGEALRRSTRLGGDVWEGQVVAAYHQLHRIEEKLARGEVPDADLWAERNGIFHEALVAGAASDRLLQLRRQLFEHFERYRRFSRNKLIGHPSRDVAGEHRDMLDAALARRGDDLADMMAAHVTGVVDLLRDEFRSPDAGRTARRSPRDRVGNPVVVLGDLDDQTLPTEGESPCS